MFTCTVNSQQNNLNLLGDHSTPVDTVLFHGVQMRIVNDIYEGNMKRLFSSQS